MALRSESERSAASPNTAAERSALALARMKPMRIDQSNDSYAIGHFVIARGFGNFAAPKSTVRDIGLQLPWIRCALALLRAVAAAPTCKQADTRHALMVDDVVGIVAIDRHTGRVDHARQLQPRAELEQDRLETAHVAQLSILQNLRGRLEDGMADCIRRSIGVGDRAIEHRHAIVAFEIGGVGKHQVTRTRPSRSRTRPCRRCAESG